MLAGWASDTASGTLQQALELSLEGLIGARVGWRHACGTGTAIGRFGTGRRRAAKQHTVRAGELEHRTTTMVKVWGKEGEEVLRSSESQEADQDGSSRVEAGGERKKRSGDVEGEVWMGRDGASGKRELREGEIVSLSHKNLDSTKLPGIICCWERTGDGLEGKGRGGVRGGVKG